MVRHNKRHSRKKGGKGGKSRGRGRRQFGGWWKSLIDAKDNFPYHYPYQADSARKPRLEPIMHAGKTIKGIDIKYKASPSEPGQHEWLIGGDDKTVGELLRGAKEYRYVDVIEAVRRLRGGTPETLPDDQKGITLNDGEFCELFVHLISDSNTKPLTLMYPNITDRMDRAGLTAMCIRKQPPPPSSMTTAQRGHSASSAPPSHYAPPSSAPPSHYAPPSSAPPSHYNAHRAIANGLGESQFSRNLAQGMAQLGRH